MSLLNYMFHISTRVKYRICAGGFGANKCISDGADRWVVTVMGKACGKELFLCLVVFSKDFCQYQYNVIYIRANIESCGRGVKP